MEIFAKNNPEGSFDFDSGWTNPKAEGRATIAAGISVASDLEPLQSHNLVTLDEAVDLCTESVRDYLQSIATKGKPKAVSVALFALVNADELSDQLKSRLEDGIASNFGVNAKVTVSSERPGDAPHLYEGTGLALRIQGSTK